MSAKKGVEIVRPLFSKNKKEARTNAIRLYRLWYRFIPFIKHVNYNHFPVTEKEMYQKLRDEFYKYRNETDIRTIDMLIHRSRSDLREVGSLWSQQCHILGLYFQPTVKPKPTKFLDKFFSSPD